MVSKNIYCKWVFEVSYNNEIQYNKIHSLTCVSPPFCSLLGRFRVQFINFGGHGPPPNQLRCKTYFAYVHNLTKGNFLRGETQQLKEYFFGHPIV